MGINCNTLGKSSIKKLAKPKEGRTKFKSQHRLGGLPFKKTFLGC